MTIWNLSKGEIFFSGTIILFQNYINEIWNGKYSLDSLDSFANQFQKNGKGKKCFDQDRYILWANYKEETPSNAVLIDKMLDDIPGEFSPQRDAPDFFDFIHGKSFIIKNNSVKVFTSTAIIQNDFASILNAAKTIMSAFYCEESPANLAVIESRICFDSIDVNEIEMDQKPLNLDTEYTQKERRSKFFSFTIHFDLEIHTKYPINNLVSYDCGPGIHKLYDLDFIIFYLLQLIFHSEKIHLDKANQFYFETPKNPQEQDIIYLAKISEHLNHVWNIQNNEPFLFWVANYAGKDNQTIINDIKKYCHYIEHLKTIQDYIQKYGDKGKLSKRKLMRHLKMAINVNPIDFTDDGNDFIASYAKSLISGESI